MNTNLRTLSLAAALTLGLGLTSLAAHAGLARAASQGKVVNLGTIKVTRADVEGKNIVYRPGSTAYLGRIVVTAADSEQSHEAARFAARSGAVYLGTVQVTANDSTDARYAAKLGQAPGTAYLGSIRVTPPRTDATLFASATTAAGHLSRLTVFKLIGALAFGRAGG